MSPFPNTRVFPADWSAHHLEAAEAFLTGQCVARGPEVEAVWPEEPKPGPVLYEGPCSVQHLSQAADRPVVDHLETPVTHRVSAPITAPWLPPGTQITVTTNPDDPHLNGRVFVVAAVETGTTNWTRDMLCTELNHAPGGVA